MKNAEGSSARPVPIYRKVYPRQMWGINPHATKFFRMRDEEFFVGKGDVPHEKGDVVHEKGDVPHEKGDVFHEKGDVPHEKGDVFHEKGDVPHEKGDVSMRHVEWNTRDVR